MTIEIKTWEKWMEEEPNAVYRIHIAETPLEDALRAQNNIHKRNHYGDININCPFCDMEKIDSRFDILDL